MTDLLWVRESEIAININVSDEHVIDQKGFWKYAFTPYAVFDTLHSYVDDDVRIGSDESEALIFARREQRIRLLQYIAPGQETLDGRYTAFINQGKGGRVIWRLEDLFWHMSSSEDSPMDFPAYLEKLYRIRRSFAWELAWALVRAAYLENWIAVENLLSKNEKGEISFRYLQSTIDSLKGEVLK